MIIILMTSIEFSEHFPSGQVISSGSLTINLPVASKRFYRHGWQSWSLATWVDATVSFPVQKPQILHAMQQDPVYAYHPYPHGSWVGAVEMDSNNIFLLGSLDLDAHVELNNYQFRGWYESGAASDWFVGYGPEQAVFAQYAELLGQRLGVTKNWSSPRIWCSWYSLYTAINEHLLNKVIEDLGDLPFDVIQVDDGWQVGIGDWEANNKFNSGMKALANRIKLTGRKAGIWLAPFIASKSSRLFNEHPGWFLRDNNLKLVSAGFNWGEQLYAIDVTHPDVLVWLTSLMKKVNQWGFTYIKLDFLYAGALPGKRHVDMPREAAYRQGVKVLRETLVEDTFFLACGAPILPSLGLCDALRIGPDVSGEWENERDAVLLYNPTIPGTKNAIRTSLHRRWLAPLVQVDSDIVYFRSKDCHLSNEQKSLLQNLALINSFKGSSDLPRWLNQDEKAQLKAFLNAKPGIKQKSRYLFEIDSKKVDFSPAIPLPKQPTGFNRISAALISWIGNQAWALVLLDRLQMNNLMKLLKDENI